MNNPKSKKILRTIYSMQGVSRPCLLKMSRYTPPTLYRIIDELMRDGYVVVSGTGEESGKGRPTDLLSLNGDLGQVAVLHISRTTFSCAVLDFSDRLLACRRHVIEPSLTPEQWVATVQADLATMCAQLGIAPTSLRGVGLAAVGPLDYKEGAMLGPLHFASPRWGRVSIKALAEQALGLPVLLDCNARAALMGHYRRDYYEKYRNLAYVTVGTGIGSGLILNRKLDSNSSVILDGLAHMIIDDVAASVPVGNTDAWRHTFLRTLLWVSAYRRCGGAVSAVWELIWMNCTFPMCVKRRRKVMRWRRNSCSRRRPFWQKVS